MSWEFKYTCTDGPPGPRVALARLEGLRTGSRLGRRSRPAHASHLRPLLFGRRRVFVLVAAAVVAAAGSGSAYAYFSSGGSGSAQASTESLQAVAVVAATGTPSTVLLPGGTADLTLTVSNPNGFPVTITAISQDGPVTVDGGSGCTSDSGTWPAITPGNSGVSVVAQSGLTIALASGTHDVDVPAAASMSTSSNTGCQRASFEVPVTVTVQR